MAARSYYVLYTPKKRVTIDESCVVMRVSRKCNQDKLVELDPYKYRRITYQQALKAIRRGAKPPQSVEQRRDS